MSASCSAGPDATVLSARELATVGQSALVVGRDGGQSALVGGRQVWTFGDTFLTLPNSDGTSLISNSFAIGPGAVGDGGVALVDRLDDAGAPDELLRPTAEELAYDRSHQALADGGCAEQPCGGRWATWPGAMVSSPDAGSALIFYFLETAAPGDFNFQPAGQSLAVWSDFGALPTRPEPAMCGTAANPTLLFCADEPGFGAAAALVDSTIYAFGCETHGLGFDCKLAQVPFASRPRQERLELLGRPRLVAQVVRRRHRLRGQLDPGRLLQRLPEAVDGGLRRAALERRRLSHGPGADRPLVGRGQALRRSSRQRQRLDV